MVGVYGVVMVLLLLFPWSLILTVLVGTVWTKVSAALSRRQFVGDCREPRVQLNTAVAKRRGANRRFPEIALTPSGR